jgi:hypothetical protein
VQVDGLDRTLGAVGTTLVLVSVTGCSACCQNARVGTYAVTGAASGMGADVAKKLRAAGHSGIGVDLNDVEVVADLSTADGRSYADERRTQARQRAHPRRCRRRRCWPNREHRAGAAHH